MSRGMMLALFLALSASAQSPGGLTPLPEEEFTRSMAAHLARRAAFSGTPDQIDWLHERGLSGAVDFLVDHEQVESDDMPEFEVEIDGGAREEIVRRLKEQGLRREDVDQEQIAELRREHRRRDQQQLRRLRTWWLDRMVRTPRPLEEKMTLFWHGHFCSSFRDVRNSYHMFMQNELQRRFATGNYKQLVHQIARDPAMLEYLDNRVSRKQHPNENFARELMELFTLGLGNYTEDDIKEAARAFTGWSFEGNRFVVRKRLHDDGTKTFLGRKGTFDGDDIIDIIFEQPAASRFIAAKIFTHFAHEEPSTDVVEALARTLRESDWELKPCLRQLFSSQEFYSSSSIGSQIKSPVDLVVSTLRAAGAKQAPGGALVVNAAAQLGQSLFDPPNVKGWAGGRDWITTSTLLARYNLASGMLGSQEDLRRMGQAAARGNRDRRPPGVDPRGMDRESMNGRAEDSMEGSMEGSMAGAMEGRRARGRTAAARRAAARRSNRSAIFDVQLALGGLFTPEDIVDCLCARFLAVAPSADLRARLIEYLEEAPIDTARLHGLLQLIVSTPEFQLS